MQCLTRWTSNLEQCAPSKKTWTDLSLVSVDLRNKTLRQRPIWLSKPLEIQNKQATGVKNKDVFCLGRGLTHKKVHWENNFNGAHCSILTGKFSDVQKWLFYWRCGCSPSVQAGTKVRELPGLSCELFVTQSLQTECTIILYPFAKFIQFF